MSHIELGSSDEEYYPEPEHNRNSCPTKNLMFSSKMVADPNPFGMGIQSSPKTKGNRNSKVKGDSKHGKYNHGRWSSDEHQKFLEAIEIYGRDWKKVQGYVGTRTSTQARSHAQKVLPHPSWVDGVIANRNSSSTTMTKPSPQSNKNFLMPESKHCQSVASDEANSDYAIFKIEKVRKQQFGRDRVNSENNVFRIAVDNYSFVNIPMNGMQETNRKYSMNIDFHDSKNDLITSPMNEFIKEQISEDDEEEDVREDFLEVPFIKHKTCDPKPSDLFDSKPLFCHDNKGNDMNLESIDKLWAPEFPMDIDEGLGPLNSLNPIHECLNHHNNDQDMDHEDEIFTLN